jgi:hypothetical protein
MLMSIIFVGRIRHCSRQDGTARLDDSRLVHGSAATPFTAMSVKASPIANGRRCSILFSSGQRQESSILCPICLFHSHFLCGKFWKAKSFEKSSFANHTCQSFGKHVSATNPRACYVIVFSGVENHSHSRYSRNLLQLSGVKTSALLNLLS